MTSHLVPPLVVTTASGGAAGDITVTGIGTDDVLVAVINLADAADLTSEFTITAADTINNTGGTATTDDDLLVFYYAAAARGGSLARS